MKIVINGRQRFLSSRIYDLSYGTVCSYANISPELSPTVAWKNGDKSGTLVDGQAIRPAENMVFNVANTVSA